MTNTIQSPPISEHPKWDAFTRSFKESNYITDFWNWLMTLTSKAAEMVLFGSVLYSGYQLIPNIVHAPAEVDAVIFVIQQGALDIGGMGLLKLAKRAGLARNSFPMRVGMTLVGLMIANVILASVKQALPMTPPWVFVTMETLLLVARAIMAVLFGHAIHALREEYGDTTITVQEARMLQTSLEELSQELARTRCESQQQLSQQLSGIQQSFQGQLSQVKQGLQQSLHERSQTLANSLHEELSSTQKSFQMRLSEIQQSFQELSTSQEGTRYQDTLARLAILSLKVQQLESSTAQQFQTVQALLNAKNTVPHTLQEQADNAEQHIQRPVLRALPVQQVQHPKKTTGDRAKETRPLALQSPTATKFDARAFVYACLRENAHLKLAEIEQRAKALGQELSQPTISRHRKQFLLHSENSATSNESSSQPSESTTPVRESSPVKAERTDESSQRESSWTDDESSYSDERSIVGA